MKYRLRQDQVVMLEQLKGKMLMTSSSSNVGLYCITEFKIIEETKTIIGMLGGRKTVTNKYLTEVKMLAFHHDGKFLATLTDDSVERYLGMFNLYYFRQTWVDFQDQLKAFDLQITETNKNQ